MEWLNVLRDKLKVLFRREQFDRELEEEMRFHQELQAEKHRENGMSAEEARSAARRQFGNTTRLREAGWHAWGWAPLERLFQDLRFTVRSLRRSPGFALSVVLLLALAIWMNTTVFTVIHSVMFAPLPNDPSEELVRIGKSYPQMPGILGGLTAPDFADLRAGSRSFEDMATVVNTRYQVSGDGELQFAYGACVTDGYFRVLRQRPALGRVFLREEYRPIGKSPLAVIDGDAVAIISHRLWQEQFGGSRDVVGRKLRFVDSSTEVAIVGVMPAAFTYDGASRKPPDIWLPFAVPRDWRPTMNLFEVLARRRPSTSNQQARAELDLFASRFQAERPDVMGAYGMRIVPLREAVLGKDYRLSLFYLAGAVGLVLLIACANVANLMLARGASRVREMATRASLGSGRLRLAGQLAAESALLSLAAGALGFVLSLASIRLVVAMAPPGLPRLGEISVNSPVFWFCLLLALAAGLMCAAVPAWQVSRMNIGVVLKEGGTVSSGRRTARLSRALVALEVAVSLMLLAGAGHFARSFVSSQQADLGGQPDHVLVADFSHSMHDPNWVRSFYGELLPRLKSIRGVKSAAVGDPPVTSLGGGVIDVEGGTGAIPCQLGFPSWEYFETMRAPILSGRLFDDRDDSLGPQVAIVSRTAARLLWPGGAALGKRVRRPHGWATVVGVVEDEPAVGRATGDSARVYFPLAQSNMNALLGVVMRTSGEATAIAPTVRAAIRSIDSRVPISRVATLEEMIAGETANLRFNTLLMSVFAVLAYVLAATGVYSLMSYTVKLRTREMSIRMALGADRGDVLRLIVRRGAVLIGIGVVVGLAGTLGSLRYLASVLPGVRPGDFAYTVFAATALLVLAALAACYIPARRAASVDVVETLRQE